MSGFHPLRSIGGSASGRRGFWRVGTAGSWPDAAALSAPATLHLSDSMTMRIDIPPNVSS